MADKVHHLKVVKPAEREVRKDTVAVLRKALRLAQKGEIDEVVIIAQTPADMADGLRWREMASSTGNFCEWIGRLEILKLNWIEQYQLHTGELDEDDIDLEDKGDGEDSDERQ